MRIWHFSAGPRPESVNGASNSAWQIAVAQARLGHEITLFLEEPPTPAATDAARGAGLRLQHVAALPWQFGRRALDQTPDLGPPDLVQMHSVFIPRQASLAWALRQARVPYVIKPAGGLSPRSLQHGALKKRVYSLLIERRRFRQAEAIVTLTEQEAQEVRAFVGPFSGPLRCIPNPVALGDGMAPAWQAQATPRRLVYLGRFDLHTKGIDILVALAARMPEFEFDLYGEEDCRWRTQFPRLKQGASDNVHFHPPVFGADKAGVLAQARACILGSRSEGFGRAIAEAMSLGVPCIIPEWITPAHVVRQHGIGLLFGADLDGAAQQLKAQLDDLASLAPLAARGLAYARWHFAPQVAAEAYLALYQEVLDALRSHASSGQDGRRAGRDVVASPAGD